MKKETKVSGARRGGLSAFVVSDSGFRLSPKVAQFVGRERELAFLAERLAGARQGGGGVVLLAGEPGIGKTRLLDEAAQLSITAGATVLRGGASNLEGMPPYLPFLEALGGHARVVPESVLRQQVGGGGSVLAVILPELNQRLGELPSTYALPHEQARLRLFEAISSFLSAIAAANPAVLILDDLQWADGPSLDLMCHVARHCSGTNLLVLGAFRQGELDRNPALERALTELARLRSLETVAPGPLSLDEIGLLASDALRGETDATLSGLLHAESEGNPFFAEELLRFWFEAGIVVAPAGGTGAWTLAELEETPLPPSIVGAVRQRLASLPNDVVEILRAAAIVGQTFEVGLLAAILEQDAELIETAIEQAERGQLLRREPAGVFTFSHHKIRECLHDEVGRVRAARLHERAGLALESRPSTPGTQRLVDLAFHFVRSDDRARGVAYSLQAAEAALKAFAAEEATKHFKAALDLMAADDGRRGALLIGLGDALVLAGIESEATNAFEEAQDRYFIKGDRIAAAKASAGIRSRPLAA